MLTACESLQSLQKKDFNEKVSDINKLAPGKELLPAGLALFSFYIHSSGMKVTNLPSGCC
jgi:hypothetical protein